MATGERWGGRAESAAAALPGAGQYFTTQQAQHAPGAGPGAKFGTSTRDQEARVFISREHERGAGGGCSPGPVTAAPASGLGRQKLSTKASAPAASFGSGKRLAEKEVDVPGPGAYYA